MHNESVKLSIDATAWQMAKEFGWTLDYIDSLPLSVMEEYRDFGAVMDGAQKAHNFLRRQNTPSPTKRKR